MQKIYVDLHCRVKASETSDFILSTTEAANNTFALFDSNPEAGHAPLKTRAGQLVPGIRDYKM